MKKRILSILMAVLLILSVVPVNLAFAAKAGDVNNDGKITAADARTALRASVKLENLDEAQTKAADVDGKAGVTAADARLILRASVGLENLHTHAYDKKVTKPTCTEKGFTTYTCECGDKYDADYVDATGHKFVNGICSVCSFADILHKGTLGNNVEWTLDAAGTLKVFGEGKAPDYKSENAPWKEYSDIIKEVIISTPTENHLYTVYITEPTCTNKGTKKYVCECGDSYVEAIPAKGHGAEIEIPAIEATCTQTGYTSGKKCSVCGAVTKAQTETPVKAHTEVEIPAVKATCTKTGLTAGKKCSVCGKITKAQTETPLAAHTEVEIPAVKATCTKTGLSEGKKCSVCGKITKAQTETPLAAHTEVEIPAVKATCTKTGLSEGKKCSVCGKITKAQTETPVIAHTEVEIPAVKATCTKEGLTAGKKCSVCGKVTKAQEKTSLAAHTEVTIPAVKATCTEAGLTEGKKCSVCGKITKAQTETPLAAHTEVDIDAVEATCTETGLTAGKKCSVCGTVTVAQEKTPVIAHTEEPILAVEATCTTEGLTAGKKCSVCGTVTVAQVKTPVKAHTEEIIPAVEATCSTTGLTAGKKCSACGTVTVAQEIIPVNNIHLSSSLDESTAIAPTCVKDGKEADKVCDACGAVTEAGAVIESAGTEHKLELTTVPASCTQDGYTVMKCTNEGCEYFDADTYVPGEPATDHSWGTPTPVEATCTEQGYTLKVCAKCEAQEKSDYTDAKGHDYTWTTTRPATCKETGEENGVCKVCGDETTRTIGLKACTPADETVPVYGSGDTYCKTVLKCIVCDEILLENENSGHLFRTPTSEITQETCTTPRTGNNYCRKCNYKELDCILADPKGHTMTPSDIKNATCEDDGYILYSGTCTDCNTTVDGQEITLKAKGHNLTGVQTCTTSVSCTICHKEVEPALGHDYSVHSKAYGTDVDSFFCNRCGAKTANELTTFNNIANRIVTPGFYNNSEYCPPFGTYNNYNLQSIGKSHITTSYSRFDFGIYTSAIKSLYEDEMANTPDDYEPVRSRRILNELPLPVSGPYTVSLLTEADIDSITTEKLGTVKISDVLSDYSTTYTIGSKEYNLQKFKDVTVTDVIKVTIDVKNEKYSQVKNLDEATLTSLQKIYDVNIRDQIDGYDENLEMTETDKGDGYEITMKMKLRDIASDAKVTYYFKADTLEPIIALYNTDLVMDQTIDMSFKIGLFSLKGALDPIVSTTYSRAYLFTHFFQQY